MVDVFNCRILSINESKKCFVSFASDERRLPDYRNIEILSLGNTIGVKSKDNIKYLGIHVDCHLRWDVHAGNLSKKLRSLIPSSKFVRNFVMSSNWKILHLALVQSHLSYGIITWGSLHNNYMKKIVISQKWILKIIFNKEFRYPSDKLFQESQLFDVRQLYCHSLLIQTFRDRKQQAIVHI